LQYRTPLARPPNGKNQSAFEPAGGNGFLSPEFSLDGVPSLQRFPSRLATLWRFSWQLGRDFSKKVSLEQLIFKQTFERVKVFGEKLLHLFG